MAQVDGPNAGWQDDLLDKLVGEWKLIRSIRGTEKENHVHVEWALNHQFLKIHMQDTNVPSEYEALILIGFDHSEQRYVVHWTDTWGGKFSAMGDGKRIGDTIPITFHYPDGPFYNTFTWDSTNQQWRFLMESVNKDGERVRFAEDVLTAPKGSNAS